MIEITKAQEEILAVLWELKNGAVSDVLNELPEPKPAYTTVATVIKVLEKKGYLNHKTYGKTKVYSPLVTKKSYGQYKLKDTFSGLFNNSLNQMASFFIKEKDASIQELDELKKLIELEIQKQKKQ